MGDQRHAKERIDEIDLSVLTARIDKLEKILISDTHDRLGAIISDRRTGVARYPARYDEILTDKEFYPVSKEAGTNTQNIISHHVLTAGAPIADVQPAVDDLVTVQFIRAVGNGAFAANRELTVSIYDGTANLIAIYYSGLAAVVGTEDGLIFPTDEFTAVATYPGSRNSFDIHNISYLRLDATGLVAAEEIAIDIHQIHHDSGGLRE